MYKEKNRTRPESDEKKQSERILLGFSEKKGKMQQEKWNCQLFQKKTELAGTVPANEHLQPYTITYIYPNN